MNIINLTSHELVIDGNTRRVLPPSGQVARCITIMEPRAPVDDIDVVHNKLSDVEGLPDPAPDTIYIVSSLVAGHPNVTGRTDVYAPRTDNTAVRDEKGRIIAVRGLQQFY